MSNIPLDTIQVNQPIPSAPVFPLPATITFPAPLSYEFRVVEYIDDDGKVGKVELQTKLHKHDQYGQVTYSGNWEPVPRVQLKK
jgi:hypothetical protein